MSKRFFSALLLSLASVAVFAESGTVGLGDGWLPAAASNSCADVKAAFANDAWHVTTCSTDPVVVGTVLHIVTNDGASSGDTTVASITATSSGGSSGGGGSGGSGGSGGTAGSGTTVTCSVSPCTVTVKLQFPLLDMSLEDGEKIAMAIVAVWAVGLGFRMVSRAITDGNSTQESEN